MSRERKLSQWSQFSKGGITLYEENDDSDFIQSIQDRKLHVKRPIFEQQDFDSQYSACHTLRQAKKKKMLEKAFSKFRKTWPTLLLGLIPCVLTMKKYSWRKNILSDIIAGLTVGVMNIPQGMAYAMLAELDPVYGLYVSFLGPLLYFIFGTSRHISLGTFALASIMLAAPIHRLAGDTLSPEISSFFADDLSGSESVKNLSLLVSEPLCAEGKCADPVMNYTSTVASDNVTVSIKMARLQIAITTTMLVGLIQFLFGIARFGFLTVYLSDPLVAGFTCGAAFHVMTSQVPAVFGVKVPRYTGIGKIIKVYIYLLSNITQANWVTISMSIVSIVLLLVFRLVINPRVTKKIKVPIPIELILVIGATMLSYFVDLNSKSAVAIVGTIPHGFPAFIVPNASLIPFVITDALTIAVVLSSSTISLAKLFSRKHSYSVNFNQELVAMGLINTFTPFLSCFVSSGSLSRSMVQEEMKGKSQIAGLVSAFLIFIVILAIGPLFSTAPTCILACIILVSLKGLLFQLQDLPYLWRVSKIDFIIWLVCFISTVVWDVDMGLLVGVAFSLLTLAARTQKPHACILGRIPTTDIYKDTRTYTETREIPGIRIFRYEGPLNFACAEHFRDRLVTLTAGSRGAGVDMTSKWNIERRQSRGAISLSDIAEESNKTSPNRSTSPFEEDNRDAENCSDHLVSRTSFNADPDDPSIQTPVPRSQKKSVVSLLRMGSQLDEVSFSEGLRRLARKKKVHHIIIDCSSLNYMDLVGVNTLASIMKDFRTHGVTILLAGCNYHIRNIMSRADACVPESRQLFISVHDAVLSCLCDRDAERAMDNGAGSEFVKSNISV